jgi:hypothetical protein
MFCASCFFTVKFNLSSLIGFISFAIISHLLFILEEICVDFHPGAAVKSKTLKSSGLSGKSINSTGI